VPVRMASGVADARWCCPPCLHGQSLFKLTSVGQRISGQELQASTAIGCRLLPWQMLLVSSFFSRRRLEVSASVFCARGIPRWLEVQYWWSWLSLIWERSLL
jgi:hypothetical protein